MEQRLKELVSKYSKEFEKPLEKYRAACKQYDAKEKDFLKDASLYKEIKGPVLCVRDITDAIAKETERITPKEVLKELKRKREQQKQEKKLKKKQKREQEYAAKHGKVCKACSGTKFLGLYSKACDNNTCVLPSGKEKEGYMPSFTDLTMSDGVFMDLCVDCGVPHGFNSERLKSEITSLEDEEEDDDEDEDEDEVEGSEEEDEE